MWSEHHTAFEVVDDAGGGTTLALSLAITDEWIEQSSNQTTLFRTPYLETVSFLVEVDGGVSCGAGGDDPANFGADCDDRL